MRQTIAFNQSWKWHDGDIGATSRGCAFSSDAVRLHYVKTGNHAVSKPQYDDSAWEPIELPHDFVSWRGKFDEEAEPFRGHLVSGVAWYRKTFQLAPEDEGRALFLVFDGAFRDSEVWVNGHFLGRHMSGYTGFCYYIGDVANYGGENTVAVRVDARELEGWWYEGGGINRPVWLVKANPLHIPMWGVCVRSQLCDGDARAEVTVDVSYANRGDDVAQFEIEVEIDGVSARVPALVHPDKKGSQTLSLSLEEPALWSLDEPNLYCAAVRLVQSGIVVDEVVQEFGIRDCTFDAARGFFLNGRPVYIKAFCCHEGYAGVGTAAVPEILEYRLRLLKDAGANAIRTAHNPPAPMLLSLCDRLGLMVMDETRLMNTSDEYMAQMESMILRDRNHPSVIMWSLGNEEVAVQGTPTGARIFKRMMRRARELDPTRPMSCALSGYWVDHMEVYAQHGAVPDVIGLNYNLGNRWEKYDELHQRHPNTPILISETGAMLTTRGVYDKDPDQARFALTERALAGIRWGNPARAGTASAYGDTCPDFACTAEEILNAAAKRPYIMGLMYWSGFDYRGETAPYPYPSLVCRYGMFDLCGFAKDPAWLFRAWWGDEPVLHILPHWNYEGREGELIEVWAYTNAEQVEFFVNGTSCGMYDVPRFGHAKAQIPYQPGRLEAAGYRGGRRVSRAATQTAGKPDAIAMTLANECVRPGGAAIVNVMIVDEEGIRVPTADNRVHFAAFGGAIWGTGNGNPTSFEPDRSPSQNAFNGMCQAIVRMGKAGTVRIMAEADGLQSASVDIKIATGSEYCDD